jgi:hypothetical protein
MAKLLDRFEVDRLALLTPGNPAIHLLRLHIVLAVINVIPNRHGIPANKRDAGGFKSTTKSGSR